MPEVQWNAKSPVAAPVCSPRFRPSAARVSSKRIVSDALLSLFLLAVLSLCGCGITYNSIPLIVEPNSVSFGSVAVGATQSVTVTLHNPGFSTVTVSGMTVADSAFALSSPPNTVPAGASVNFQITFAPAAAKDYSSQIAIMSEGKHAMVPVSGTGQQSTSQPVPPTAPAMQLSATTLQFGTVAIGATSQQSITVSSTGTAPLQISSLNANGVFSAQTGSLPLTLQPGQALQLPVDFAPKTAGSTTGQLVIASNAAASPSVTVTLAGSGASAPPPTQPPPTQPPPTQPPPTQPPPTQPPPTQPPPTQPPPTQPPPTQPPPTQPPPTQPPPTQPPPTQPPPTQPPPTQPPPTQPPPTQPPPTQPPPTQPPPTQPPPTQPPPTQPPPTQPPPTQPPPTQPPPTQPPPTLTPVLTVSSVSVDFGSVPTGAQSPSEVTLTSSGTAAVVLQAVAATGDGFSAGQLQLPLTLAPGQQVTLPLSFAPTSTGSKQGQIALTDNATGSPSTIALTGTGTAAASPSLSISPGSVDFGDATVGSGVFKTITLVANGTVPVTVNSVAVGGTSFSGTLQGLPRVLQPSQQMSVKVQFKPRAEGRAKGQVTVVSNSAANGTAVVAVQGNGVAPPSPSLAGSVSSLSFGKVTVGSRAMKLVTVTSTGTAPATITGGSLSGSGYTATYAGVPVQSLAAPITLQPGQQVSFNVGFHPAKVGAADGQLNLSTDTGSPVSVSLTGTGTAQASPALTLSATSLDFGNAQVNMPAVLQLTLTSSGTAPVTISSGTVTGQGFQISSAVYPAGINGWPATLRPGQQIILAVAFDPTTVGAATGSLTVDSDASGGTTSVALTGTGAAAPAPKLTLSTTSLSFGPAQIGAKVTRTVTLSSSGDAPLVISAITLTGTQFSDGSPSLPVTLQPNQQLAFTVTFDPTTAGPDAETLTVTSNDGSGPATVSLGGSGTVATVPQLTVNPLGLDFGIVPTNTPSTKPVTLTSTGSAPVTVSAATVTGAGFSLSGASLPITLNPNQSVTLQVQFDPAAAGGAIGQLTITSDSTTNATVQVPLTGAGAVAVAPQLSVSPGALTFGNVTVNSAATLPLTLTSTGTAPVTVSAATLSGAGFAVSGSTFPLTLNPNQSLTLHVQFDPTTAGPATGQLTIASDSTVGATTLVQLSGTGTVAAIPQLAVSAGALAFGNVTVSSTATMPLTLTSTGTAPVTVTTATLSGADFSESGAALPLTLNPNQSVTLQVQFAPSAPEAATGQLTIVSNSSTNGMAVVQLSGTGTAATSPQLTVSATTLAFGTVPVNTTATLPVTLTSSGTAPVTVNAATLGGAGFSDSGAAFPVTLNPNQSVTLQVQFDPGAAGAAAGQLTINSNSSGGATTVVQLSGTGAVPTVPQLTISTGSLSFGNVTVNTSATLPVTLTSTGTAAVTVNAAAVGGAGFSDSGSTFPVTLNPNQSVTLQVAFDPTTAGAATGQLVINSNSTTGATALVQLNGTGTAAPSPKLLVSTTALAFGNVAVNSTATLSVTLSSAGTSPLTVTAAALTGTGFSDSGATFPVTLNPNQSVTLQVAFDPTSAGAASGQLTIASNSSTGGMVAVQVSGTGTAVPHQIDLNWYAPTDSPDPVAGYNIYRSLNGGASYTKLNAAAETLLSYEDDAVQSGSTYTYVVKSVDASGVESPASNQISLAVP